eukprot:m.444574 g.444574  ORF g.444574 m.444574 type:complete len:55 (-) comp19113_c0_seq1:1263-1427(-)
MKNTAYGYDLQNHSSSCDFFLASSALDTESMISVTVHADRFPGMSAIVSQRPGA